MFKIVSPQQESETRRRPTLKSLKASSVPWNPRWTRSSPQTTFFQLKTPFWSNKFPSLRNFSWTKITTLNPNLNLRRITVLTSQSSLSTTLPLILTVLKTKPPATTEQFLPTESASTLLSLVSWLFYCVYMALWQLENQRKLAILPMDYLEEITKLMLSAEASKEQMLKTLWKNPHRLTQWVW